MAHTWKVMRRKPSNHAMGANGWQLWFLTFHEMPPSSRSDALSRQPLLILFSLGDFAHAPR